MPLNPVLFSPSPEEKIRKSSIEKLVSEDRQGNRSRPLFDFTRACTVLFGNDFRPF